MPLLGAGGGYWGIPLTGALLAKYSEKPYVVIPEVCKIGKILYMNLYREKWYRKVA